MVLRKVVRLFGWMIAMAAAIIPLYNLYQALSTKPFSDLLNLPTLLQAGMLFLFLIGFILSTQNQILGGVFTFLSPFIYLTIVSILTGHLVTPIFPIFMLIGGVFLLFTAERE